VRVYVPATIGMLRRLVADGALHAVSGTAFGVTPALRESYAVGTTEELEYAAMADAARASLRLLAGSSSNGAELPRRVVVCADVDGVTLRPDLDPGAVTLPGPVPNAVIAAVYVDLPAAAEAVRAAAEVVDAADMGDPDAEFVLGDADDHDLAWYATQEVPFLIELL
jgi:hypothetical protein